ncbi:PAAR domain-containing protein [Pseudomonas asiatica]|uniref:PAAR domain-containing protein n=1 Tax=Pseudomonas asiatica TaxID=2219225 RepID=A0A9X4I320_9PSED|nr:PAAR domain-containing protein [Pseudomonas asiatica]MDD2115404.1 PAAR domain-containing protein [Pseudomonas asiatica]WJN49508.1 PAAR domain-containing protein [Pseudomonas asiatica]
MKCVIRIGDRTTGGGTVLSGSTAMYFDGIGVAREGDPVDCPVLGHGRTVIAEGHAAFKDNGVPVAFDGHRCACGCALISSMPSAGVN